MSSSNASEWINSRNDNTNSNIALPVVSSAKKSGSKSIISREQLDVSRSIIPSSSSSKTMYEEYAKKFIETCHKARKGLQYTLTTNTPYYRAFTSSDYRPSSSSSSTTTTTTPPVTWNINVTTPTLLHTELQAHQKTGLRWLLATRFSGLNGILADEMGLGKTIQIIAYFSQLLQWEIEDLQNNSSHIRMWSMSEDTYSTSSVSDNTIMDTTLVSSNDIFGTSTRPGPGTSTKGQPSLEPFVTSSTPNSITKKIEQVQQELAKLNHQSVTETTLSGGTDVVDRLVHSLSSDASSHPYHILPWAWASSIANSDDQNTTGILDDKNLTMLRFRRGSAGPHLIICPSSVMANWENEIQRFCPWLSVTIYRPVGNDKRNRKTMKERLQRSNVIVCNYTMFERSGSAADMIMEREWDTLVLDEAHDMKNSTSTRFANVSEIHARHRILLTGTPVQNNLNELVSLLRFIIRDCFILYNNGRYESNDDVWLDDDDANGNGENPDVQKKFVDALTVQINAMVKSKRNGKMGSRSDETDNSKPNESFAVNTASALGDMLSLFILRRTKESIQLNLPPKIQQNVWVQPINDQQAILNALHYTALSILGNNSIVGKALTDALSLTNNGTSNSSSSTTSSDPNLQQLRSRRMAFVGQLCGMVSDTTSTINDSISLSNLEYRSGFAGKLLSLLRKAAIHPLLLRSWYSNEQCLEIAHLLHREQLPSLTSKPKRTNGKRNRHLSSNTDRYFEPGQINTLNDLLEHHPELSSTELLQWAEGDKSLARQAEYVLSLPDYSIHQVLLSLPSNNSLLLPPEAFRDTPKMSALLNILQNLPIGSKSLVFSGFTEVLDITAIVLQDVGIHTMRIDGQTEIDRRQLIINEFSSENNSVSVMLLSTRAGGVGINLTAATTVIFLDQDWNAQVMLQAEARAHRIGQTKPVHVYRILTEQSIELHMVNIADDKNTLSTTLLRGTEKTVQKVTL